jgi:hypothetical protein
MLTNDEYAAYRRGLEAARAYDREQAASAAASDSYAPGGRSASFGTFGNMSPGAQNMSIDSACLRAPNEDDDGYDPYSDRILPAALFEENPWD